MSFVEVTQMYMAYLCNAILVIKIFCCQCSTIINAARK